MWKFHDWCKLQCRGHFCVDGNLFLFVKNACLRLLLKDSKVALNMVQKLNFVIILLSYLVNIMQKFCPNRVIVQHIYRGIPLKLALGLSEECSFVPRKITNMNHVFNSTVVLYVKRRLNQQFPFHRHGMSICCRSCYFKRHDNYWSDFFNL